jgi:hypothetical protein
MREDQGHRQRSIGANHDKRTLEKVAELSFR